MRAYWRFPLEPTSALDDAASRALVEELRSCFAQAVRRRLMSDVPLGMFLSGGIDSSAIARLAARHRPARSITTFTIGFTEPSFDESSYARTRRARDRERAP